MKTPPKEKLCDNKLFQPKAIPKQVNVVKEQTPTPSAAPGVTGGVPEACRAGLWEQ